MDSRVYQTYFSLEETHWWFLGRKKILTDIIRRTVPSQIESACDIGCGKGENLALLAPIARRLHGIEMSAEAARLAMERFPNAAIKVGLFPTVSAGERIDLVTMFDVLEHIDDDAASLKSIYESLAPNGLLICTVPAFPFLWSAHDDIVHHKRRYIKKSLQLALERAGFKIEQSTYFNMLFFFPTIVFRFLKRISKNNNSDLFPFPGPINYVFTKIFCFERFILRLVDIPFGVSLLAVARKLP